MMLITSPKRMLYVHHIVVDDQIAFLWFTKYAYLSTSSLAALATRFFEMVALETRRRYTAETDYVMILLLL